MHDDFVTLFNDVLHAKNAKVRKRQNNKVEEEEDAATAAATTKLMSGRKRDANA